MTMEHRWVRWPIALVAGFGAIAVLALVMQQIIQGALGVRWVIHWFETVPFIALLFAYLIDRRLRA